MSASQESRKRKRAKNERGVRRFSSILVLPFALAMLFYQGCGTRGDEAVYQRAQRFWEKKMYALAAQNYEQFFLTQPHHPKAAASLYKAADIYAYDLSAYPKAVELFLRLTVVYPDTPYAVKAHEELAEIYATQLKRYPQAVFQYQEILDLRSNGTDQDLSGIQYKIGRCFFLMGDWERALAAYERVLREYPRGEKADSAAYQIGYIRLLSGRYEEAEESFRLFLHRYPESAWAFDGMLYLEKSKEKQHFPGASPERYREIEERYPDRPEDHRQRRTQTGAQ